MISKAASLLTDEQKLQYQERGYCVVPGLFTSSEIQEIEDFFEDFKIRGGQIYDRGATYTEIDPAKEQLRAMQPHRHDSRAVGWVTNPNVAAVLEDLLEKPALVAQTMYYFKPPGGKGQGMHQDNFYLVSQPATCIAAWTAIDTADIDNGCLWVVPGSHKGNILCPSDTQKERWMDYGDSHISKFPREAKPEPVVVQRGETMFFGGNLIHGSGPNRTKDRFRRTFIGHYIDEASDHVARFYHPVLNMQGEPVSNVAVYNGGGPCGDGWSGAVH